jgi:hypothetical protein
MTSGKTYYLINSVQKKGKPMTNQPTPLWRSELRKGHIFPIGDDVIKDIADLPPIVKDNLERWVENLIQEVINDTEVLLKEYSGSDFLGHEDEFIQRDIKSLRLKYGKGDL